MRLACISLFALAASCSSSATASSPELQPPATLVVTASQNNFADTVSRLLAAIETKGLRVFATIDHSANASGAGLALEPTIVVIFGNPKVGTQLMQRSRTAAIDLPQKLLVWQEGAVVKVAYNNPAYLGQRHELGEMPVLDKIAGLLAGLATAATTP